MKLRVDIDPLKAMEIYYDGEESGVWEGEFIKNEKQRGLVFPQKLKEFLIRFGFFGVNTGGCRLLFPDNVSVASIPFESDNRDMLVMGIIKSPNGDIYLGIFADECDFDDPPISLGEAVETEDGRLVLSFGASGMRLRDILVYAFSENLFALSEGTDYGDEFIKELIQKYSAELCEGEKSLEQLLKEAHRPCRFVCYEEDEERFLCFNMHQEGGMVSVFSPHIGTEELEALFRKEFYQNSLNCDFAHSLRLLEKIIDRIEQDKAGTVELGEKYRLAGRCCWALEQWDKAEKWLKKAEPIYNAKSTPAQSKMSFYQGLGNFYSDKGDKEKSLAAYQKEEQLAEENGVSVFKSRGDRLMREGVKLTEEDRLEEAVEVFEKALEQYKQNPDPKECKYEIARCGQLKGDAKSIIKKRRKASEQ